MYIYIMYYGYISPIYVLHNICKLLNIYITLWPNMFKLHILPHHLPSKQ